jgi:hypothetical protein
MRWISPFMSFVAVLLGVIASAAEWDVSTTNEFVELRSDTLRAYSLGLATRLSRSSMPQRYELADDSALVLDESTPAGVYPLPDGGRIEVRRPEGMPLQVTFSSRPVRVLPFRFQVSRFAGLFVQPVGDTALRSPQGVLAEFMAAKRRWLGAEYRVWESSGTRAVEISKDWCANGHVPLPDTTPGLVRILWLSTDSRLAGNDRMLRDAARRTPDPSRGSVPRPPGQVVGSVLVDLASGRVVQRQGQVRQQRDSP